MRSFFSVALTSASFAAIANAQQTLEDMQQLENNYFVGGHVVESEHGYPFTSVHHHATVEGFEHEPVIHGATAPIVAEYVLDPERIEARHDLEALNPEHVFHSAEQLAPYAPHAIRTNPEAVHYAPYEKYHAHGSHHPLGNYRRLYGHTDDIEAATNAEEEANYFVDPYTHTVAHHAVYPDDRDYHHGPQLHATVGDAYLGDAAYVHAPVHHEVVERSYDVPEEFDTLRSDVTFHYEKPEPVVYDANLHHSTQPLVHHTAPHVERHPKVYHEQTPVAVHHEGELYTHSDPHVIVPVYGDAPPVHDVHHSVVHETIHEPSHYSVAAHDPYMAHHHHHHHHSAYTIPSYFVESPGHAVRESDVSLDVRSLHEPAHLHSY